MENNENTETNEIDKAEKHGVPDDGVYELETAACPTCGEHLRIHAVTFSTGRRYYATCEKCLAVGEWRGTPDEAVAAFLAGNRL